MIGSKGISYERYMITGIVVDVAVALLWGIISALNHRYDAPERPWSPPQQDDQGGCWTGTPGKKQISLALRGRIGTVSPDRMATTGPLSEPTRPVSPQAARPAVPEMEIRPGGVSGCSAMPGSEKVQPAPRKARGFRGQDTIERHGGLGVVMEKIDQWEQEDPASNGRDMIDDFRLPGSRTWRRMGGHLSDGGWLTQVAHQVAHALDHPNAPLSEGEALAAVVQAVPGNPHWTRVGTDFPNPMG